MRSNLEQLPVGGLQLRDELKNVAVAKAQPTAAPTAGEPQGTAPQAAAAVVGAAAPTGKVVQPRPAPAPAAVAPAKNDDKW
ncbi:hypothetical protein [Variovorax sp. WS11]|uniref:hypothetical protein n=1 Tax=Variovorax sp. WS11 TaxID=1105204 RepID=UPI001EF1C10B|nr:hypothetical protein [Variovorax sp. WS11]